jgi:hypothetical protein
MTTILDHNRFITEKQSLSPRYCEKETSAGRSTRMIIESSSYVTTPCDSPPDDLRSAYANRGDNNIAGITEGLAQVNVLLCASIEQNSKYPKSVQADTAQETTYVNTPAWRGQQRSELKHSWFLKSAGYVLHHTRLKIAMIVL